MTVKLEQAYFKIGFAIRLKTCHLFRVGDLFKKNYDNCQFVFHAHFNMFRNLPCTLSLEYILL